MIGLVARADNTGLGVQSWEFFKHVPCKALVIDFSNMISGGYGGILTPHLDRFPGQQVFRWGNRHNLRGDMPYNVMEQFLEGVSTVFMMETPYDFNLIDVCRVKRIKTILQLNYEFLDYPSRLPMPSLLAAPSPWNYEHIPDPKILLPVPVNTDHFKTNRKENTFVHIVGRPAVHDRNGTSTFLNALLHVKSEITVHLMSQRPLTISGNLPSNVKVITDVSNKENYYDNYQGGTLVLPRKYGGLCLVMNEAIAAGMPVITTDISPNNQWLPKEWLVPAYHSGNFQAKKRIAIHEADSLLLAKKIDEFCNPSFYNSAVDRAEQIRDEISWKTLLPTYQQIL